MSAAWSENLILEKYYAPVLDTPSYVSRTGHRWPADQRAHADQRRGVTSSYESRADATEGHHFIRTWSPVVLWMGVMIGVCGMLGFCFVVDRTKS
jgi:hypothetical protein